MIIEDVKSDLRAIGSNPLIAAISNRGFHALVVYRISRTAWIAKIPLIPLILTRMIQIIYSIDIDYRAKIGPGVIIVHGVGLVVGQGVVIKGNTKIYHGVTLGISDNGKDQGFPTICEDVILGAGAKILGSITIAQGARVGANAVVIRDVPEYSVAVGIPAKILPRKI